MNEPTTPAETAPTPDELERYEPDERGVIVPNKHGNWANHAVALGLIHSVTAERDAAIRERDAMKEARNAYAESFQTQSRLHCECAAGWDKAEKERDEAIRERDEARAALTQEREWRNEDKATYEYAEYVWADKLARALNGGAVSP